MELTINVDSDGVVYDWHGFMIPYLSKHLQVEMTRDHFIEWDLAKSLGISKTRFYKVFDQAVNDGAFFHGGEIPGAVDGINRLIDAGHRVRIVTNKILKGADKTQLALIDTVGFYTKVDLIDKVEFVFTGSKYGKTEYPAHVVVDDKPDLSWVQAGAINVVFDQPWNRKDLQHLPGPGEDPNFDITPLYRAEGWEMVLELVEQAGGGILRDKSPIVV